MRASGKLSQGKVIPGFSKGFWRNARQCLNGLGSLLAMEAMSSFGWIPGRSMVASSPSSELKAPRLTGIPLSTLVADLWINGDWSLRHARSQRMEEVQIHLTTISLTDEPSTTEWIVNGTPKHTFSPSTVYHSFFEDTPTVPWHHIIWFKKVYQNTALSLG